MDAHQEVMQRKRSKWPTVVALIVVALSICVIVEGFFLFGSFMTVRAKARETMSSLHTYVDSVKKGDQEKLLQSAQEVHGSAHSIQHEIQTLPWTLASIAPQIGSDVRSARTLVDELVNVSDEVLLPLAQSSELMSLSNLMQNSAVNMQALESVAAIVRRIEPVMSRSSKTVASLPPAKIKEAESILETARNAFLTANDAITRVNPILGDLPMLLGANGQQKNYLIVASNNGELHAAGGYVGSVGVLSVVDGHFSLGDFTDIRNVLPVDSVSAGATAEEIKIFGERVDTHHGDHNMIPDFSRVGELYWNIWSTANGIQLDGVIGVDPIFLQRVLKFIGKIDTSYGVSVDGKNAASVIINECLFFGWKPTQCDDFYTEVASKSFNKLLTRLGSLDTLSFMEAVATSATEGRCNAWIADDMVEQHIKQAGFGWELPHEISSPLLGVFVSDFSTSKAAYYLSLDTSMSEPTANPDGTKTYMVTTTLKHNMDRTLASGELPGYIVTGWSAIAETRSKVELLEKVSLVAPEGGVISGIQSVYAGSVTPTPEVKWSEYAYQGNNTWVADVRIDAGETCTFTYAVTVPSEALRPLEIRQSPVVPHEVRGD